jgi:hypothetical protein
MRRFNVLNNGDLEEDQSGDYCKFEDVEVLIKFVNARFSYWLNSDSSLLRNRIILSEVKDIKKLIDIL